MSNRKPKNYRVYVGGKEVPPDHPIAQVVKDARDSGAFELLEEMEERDEPGDIDKPLPWGAILGWAIPVLVIIISVSVIATG